MTPIILPATYRALFLRLSLWLAAWLMQALSGAILSGESNPLEPVDTASPRTTLEGFIEVMNAGYTLGYGRVQTYLDSSTLFLSEDDIDAIHSALHRLEAAERTIDFSALPPAMIREASRRLTLQLKDILDRIELPPLEAVPDATAMAAAEFKHWTLPGTEIRIARVENGSRAGEYLFTSEIVSRLPEFHDKAAILPYQPGASIGLYEFSTNSPAGLALLLHRVVPARWLLDPPRWSMARLLDQPFWRWFGISAVLGAGFAFVVSCHYLSRRWGIRKRPPGAGRVCCGRPVW